MAEIRVENLHKAFGDFVAVKDSSFTIGDGEFFCLLGPSGCGKTTTLRMIAGLELPSTGRILLDGEDVTFRRAAERDIAFVFQLFALYPHMTVRANVGFPLKCQGMSRSQIRAGVEEAAMVDGYTRLQAFWKVVLPQASTGIAATAIFCLIFSWNEYAFAVLLTSGVAQTTPPFIPFIIGEGGQDWPAVAAGTTLFLIPIVVFTILLRKLLLRGITFGAVRR